MSRRLFPSKKCLYISAIVFFTICILNYSRYEPLNEQESLPNQLAIPRKSLSILNLTCQAPAKPVQDCEPVMKLANRFPRAIIIGFGKAGTRALLNTLLMHPSIRGPHVEVNYFDQYYKSEGLQWYLESFPPSKPNTINIEKSPQYIRTPAALKRLISVLEVRALAIPIDSIKFIVVMREPITRAISEYVEWTLQRFKNKAPALPSFDDMVLHSDTQPIFITSSEYDHHIASWLEYFSLDQFCFVDGELFIQDPYQVVVKLETCLGIPHHFKEDNFIYNSQKGFYCFRDRESAQCLNKSKGRSHPTISEETRRYLNQHYKSHNQQLTGITRQQYMWT